MLNKRFFSFTLGALGLFVVTASSAFASDDLLTVNKTVFIQIALFLISIYILNTLVFKPFLNLMDRRDKLTRGAVEEAKELEEKVVQIIDEYEAKLAEARVLAVEERNKIVHEGEKVAEGILSKTREETSGLLQEAKHKLEADTLEIKNKVKSDVDSIAKDIASRVLGKEIAS
jgi:F-type H+-transporting ATPase subunit b